MQRDAILGFPVVHVTEKIELQVMLSVVVGRGMQVCSCLYLVTEHILLLWSAETLPKASSVHT
jgi:hypothetical protein